MKERERERERDTTSESSWIVAFARVDPRRERVSNVCWNKNKTTSMLPIRESKFFPGLSIPVASISGFKLHATHIFMAQSDPISTQRPKKTKTFC